MKNDNPKYEPIENYGIIGNLHTVALVSKKASIDFMCFPRFDSPTIFASLLDCDNGGQFSITPGMENMTTRQLYLPDTAIMITRFFSDDGIAEITDFMPVEKKCGIGTIFRRVSSIRNDISFHMACCPKFDYGRYQPAVKKIADGCVEFQHSSLATVIRLTSTVLIDASQTDVTAAFMLKQSDTAWFMFSPSGDALPADTDLQTYAAGLYKQTISFWQKWTEQATYKGRWRELVIRSIITLKLLTSYEFGSVVAAPTFSLPEVIGGSRNWDYRYTWIRDGAFTMYAFLRLGFIDEARAFIEWIRTQCLKKPLQLMYAVDGSTDLVEEVLDHLEGYKNSQPVRIGNAAHSQFQLDIYGELLDTIYLFNKEGGAITYDFWLEIEKLVNFVDENWQEPDHGIWEIRNEKRNFLHSRLMAWVAMDRAIKIAEVRSFPFPRAQWFKTRDNIYTSIFSDFWNEEVQSFVQHKDSHAIDASVLLMPLMRFISSHEPRWKKTLETMDKSLRLDVLIYRYSNALEKIDGLEGDEGTFNMCSFWFIECLAMAGQVERARENFEKMIGYANHLGLFAEEIGTRGEQLGNFPQAFTHLALISAAMELDKDLAPIG